MGALAHMHTHSHLHTRLGGQGASAHMKVQEHSASLRAPWPRRGWDASGDARAMGLYQRRLSVKIMKTFPDNMMAPPPPSYVLRALPDARPGQLCGDGLQVRAQGFPRAAPDDCGEDQEAGGGGRLLQHRPEQLQKHCWADERPDQLCGPGALPRKPRAEGRHPARLLSNRDSPGPLGCAQNVPEQR